MRWLLKFQMDRLLSSSKSLLPESMAFCAFATSHLRIPFVFYSRISTPLAPVRFRGIYARLLFRPTTPVILSAAPKGGGCGGKESCCRGGAEGEAPAHRSPQEGPYERGYSILAG